MRKSLALLLTAVTLTALLIIPVKAEDARSDASFSYTAPQADTVSVSGTDKVYRVGEGGMTLKKAFSSAPVDGTPVTILLTESVTYGDRLTVPAGANVTLNLNGCRMKYKSATARACLYVTGRLTVAGNGTIENSLFATGAHGIVVNAGGVLDVRGGTVFVYGGNAIHIVRGRLESISGGAFTSMLGDCISCTGSVGSITGGGFSGKRAIVLYYGARAERLEDGIFRASSCSLHVKTGASVGRIGQATFQTQTGSSYTVNNSGTIDVIDGATVNCMRGTGAIVNYGYIKEMKAVSVTMVSQTRGSGCGVFNARGQVDSMDVTVTANTIGVWNKGGTIGRLTGSVVSDHGYGVYQNYGGSITELNMDVTSYNRACIRNVDGSRIDTVSGGRLIADRENRRYADARCIAIYNMSGAEIGKIDGVQVTSHGACIGNSGGVIREIAGGDYNSEAKTVVNINGGRIYAVTGGTFNVPYDAGIIG